MALLTVADLHKSYTVAGSRLPVLRGLSLSVEAGEMVAVVGASGVGKSTLLHLLGGLDHADAGRDPHRRRRRCTGCATARWSRSGTATSGSSSSSTTCCRSSTPSRTPRCRCASRGCRSPRPGGRATELLERVGLAGRLAHRPCMMSGGEQQRVAIARALVTRPSLLLADEPTGNLDEQTADALHLLIREMHREHGLTSVIATHNPRLAGVCDRVLRLADGALAPA